MNYPVSLEPDDDGTILVTFPDIPEAITCGGNEVDALANAEDALVTAVSIYIQDRRDVPEPSAPAGRKTVSLSLLGQLKLALYRAVRAKGWRKADLARALRVDAKTVDRLLDLRHSSTVAQLEAGLAACGCQAEIETCELAAA